MYEELKRFFIDCNDKFVSKETDLILSGVSERCLCGSFMLILHDALKASKYRSHFTDIEYNRNFDGQIKTIIDDKTKIINITCDLIVHSRGRNAERDNLIAIEMKRDTHSESEKNNDRDRLRALTKPTNDSNTFSADGRTFPRHVCGYQIGIFYEISIKNRRIEIEYYRNGEFHNRYSRAF